MLACVAVGVGIGWLLRGEPPPAPVVAEAKREAIDVHETTEATEDKAEAVTVAMVLPPVESTRWRVKYRPAPTGGCEVDEIEGEGSKIGAGSVNLASNATSSARASGTLGLTSESERLRLEVPPPPPPPRPLPRVTLGGGVSAPVHDPTGISPVVSVGLRLTSTITARATADVRLGELRESRLLLTAEVAAW